MILFILTTFLYGLLGMCFGIACLELKRAYVKHRKPKSSLDHQIRMAELENFGDIWIDDMFTKCDCGGPKCKEPDRNEVLLKEIDKRLETKKLSKSEQKTKDLADVVEAIRRKSLPGAPSWSKDTMKPSDENYAIELIPDETITIICDDYIFDLPPYVPTGGYIREYKFSIDKFSALGIYRWIDRSYNSREINVQGRLLQKAFLELPDYEVIESDDGYVAIINYDEAVEEYKTQPWPNYCKICKIKSKYDLCYQCQINSTNKCETCGFKAYDRYCSNCRPTPRNI